MSAHLATLSSMDKTAAPRKRSLLYEQAKRDEQFIESMLASDGDFERPGAKWTLLQKRNYLAKYKGWLVGVGRGAEIEQLHQRSLMA